VRLISWTLQSGSEQQLCLTKKWAVSWFQSFLEVALQKEGGEGSGPPYSGEKSRLEPSRDGENMRRNGGEPYPDVMKKDQGPIK
jgi:hypothetical protein